MYYMSFNRIGLNRNSYIIIYYLKLVDNAYVFCGIIVSNPLGSIYNNLLYTESTVKYIKQHSYNEI